MAASTNSPGYDVDIRDETFAICRKLGLDPNDVRDLTWSPSEITATVYLKDAEGRKYVDLIKNAPAMEQRRYALRVI